MFPTIIGRYTETPRTRLFAELDSLAEVLGGRFWESSGGKLGEVERHALDDNAFFQSAAGCSPPLRAFNLLVLLVLLFQLLAHVQLYPTTFSPRILASVDGPPLGAASFPKPRKATPETCFPICCTGHPDLLSPADALGPCSKGLINLRIAPPPSQFNSHPRDQLGQGIFA